MDTYSKMATLSLWFNDLTSGCRHGGRSPIFGVGINDAKHKISASVGGKTISDPAYILWQSMIARVYSESP